MPHDTAPKPEVRFKSVAMVDCATESRVSTNGQFKAVAHGDLHYLFSIGQDGKLYLFHRSSTSASGWLDHCLTPWFNESLKATAFDATSNINSGLLSIAFATNVRQDNLHLARDLDPTRVDWDTAPGSEGFWETISSFVLNGSTIDHILLKDGGMILTSEHGYDDAQFFQIAPSGEGDKVSLPENANKILDVQTGNREGLPGYFLLFGFEDGSTDAMFQSFRVSAYGGRVTRKRFYPPKDVTAISVVPDQQGGVSDTVFVAAQDIYIYEHGASDYTRVVEGVDGVKINKIVATSVLVETTSVPVKKKNAYTVWYQSESKSQERTLGYASNNFLNKDGERKVGTWSGLVPVRRHSARFSPILSGGDFCHFLYYVTDDNKLSYISQGAEPAQWLGGGIALRDTGNLNDFNSYHAELKFDTPTLRKILGAPEPPTITLTASAQTFIQVNGTRYEIGPNTPIDLEMDRYGPLVVLTYELEGTPSLLLYVKASFLDRGYVFDMSEQVIEAFRTLKDAASINAARQRNGAPLVRPNSHLDKPALDNLGDAIQRLIHLRDSMLERERAKFNGEQTEFDKDALLGSTVVGGIPAILIPFVEEGGAAVALTGGVAAVLAAGVTLAWLLFDMLPSTAFISFTFEIVGFVAYVSFEIGEKALQFVVREIADVLVLLFTVFKAINTSLEAMWSWLSTDIAWDAMGGAGFTFQVQHRGYRGTPRRVF